VAPAAAGATDVRTDETTHESRTVSTLKLTKDHPKYGRKGTVATVPFLEARALVAAGAAERPGDARAPAPVVPTVPQVAKSDLDAAVKRVAEVEAANDRLQGDLEAAAAENKKLKTELDAALKRAADAEKKLADGGAAGADKVGDKKGK
jgi:hypothetical protein